MSIGFFVRLCCAVADVCSVFLWCFGDCVRIGVGFGTSSFCRFVPSLSCLSVRCLQCVVLCFRDRASGGWSCMCGDSTAFSGCEYNVFCEENDRWLC